jgi:hypothetical protein
MKKDKFYSQYPLVFPGGEPEEGFHCGSGWYQLLDCLFFVINKELEKLTDAERKHPGKFHITRIKEKFGTLVIYYDNATDYIKQTIAQAMEMSGHICEICGEYGEIRDSALWIKVRCDDCEKKQFARRNVPLSPEAQTALDDGIRSAKADIEAGKPPIDLGSFAQYADDDEE